MAADLTGGAVLLSRTRERRDFAVPSQPEVRIGYDRSNDVAIPYEGVSRRHALIRFDGKEYWIEDVGSANGTYLNATRLLQRERLKHLDVVTLGRRADLIFVRRSGDIPRKAKLGITAARLEILDGLDAGTKRELPRGSVTIGRSPGNNIVADSQLVSKVHARIERTGVELVLTDLQSANGSFVNGEKIDSRALKDGDEISVGRARSYRVRIEQGEVLTGDVAVSDKPGLVSLSSLPMDWRTHMEWSPAEAAEFDRARAKLRPSTQPAEKPPDAKAPAAKSPAAKPATPKAEEPRHAKPEKPEKPEAAPAGPARAAEPAPAEKKPAGKEPVAAKPEAVKEVPARPPAVAEKPASPSSPSAPTAEKPAVATPPAAKAAAPPPPDEPKPAIPVPVPVVAKEAPASVPTPAPAVVPPPPMVRPSPVPAPPPAREATATRALTPDQLPRVFLETPTRTFPLGLGTFAIGRDPASDVRLDGSEISRHHARLQVTDQAATLEDLKTVNGTFVNRQKLAAPRTLADGDEVTFGSLRFKFRFGAGYPKA